MLTVFIPVALLTGCIEPESSEGFAGRRGSAQSESLWQKATQGGTAQQGAVVQTKGSGDNQAVHVEATGTSQAPAPPSDPAAAVEAARSEAKRDPRNWRPFHALGAAYYKMGRFSEAITAYQQAISLYPITSTVEAEQKQQMAARAALNAQQEAARAAEAQKNQEGLNQAFAGIIGMMASGVNPGLGTAVNASMAISRQLATQTSPSPTPAPAVAAESQFKPRQELAGLYFDLGAAQRSMEAYSDAIKSFEQVTGMDPTRTDAFGWMGVCYYFLGSYGKCISYTSRYMTLAPGGEAFECLMTMSHAFRDAGMPSEAQVCFARAVSEGEKAVKQEPHNDARVGALAYAFLDNDEWGQALEWYKKALALKPNDPATRLAIAQCQFALGLGAEAKNTLSSLVPLAGQKPARFNDAYFWYLMGRLGDASCSAEDAREAYRKSVAAFEASKEQPPTFIAVSYDSIGQHERAVQILLNSLARNGGQPASCGDWFRLALVQDKANQDVEAVDALDHCLEFKPHYPFGLTLQKDLIKKHAATVDAALAKSAEAEGKQQQVTAIKQLGLAYALTPCGERKHQLQQKLLELVGALREPIPMTAESRRCYLRGNAVLKEAHEPHDVDLAIAEYRRALAHSPWAPEIYLSLAVAYGTCYEFHEAEDQLKLFLMASPNTQNMDEVLKRLYEMEVQHEQTMRGLAALCPK